MLFYICLSLFLQILRVANNYNLQARRTLAKKVRFGTIARPYIAIVLWSEHLYLLFTHLRVCNGSATCSRAVTSAYASTAFNIQKQLCADYHLTI